MNNPFSLNPRLTSEGSNDSHDRAIWLLALTVLILGALAAIAVSITSLPFTEGWYETLVYLEKHGFQAYKTIDFVLPPVTIVVFRALDSLTHSSFAGNKIFGVFLSLVDVGLIYLWTRRFVANSAALFATAFLFVLMTAEPLYIPGDYHDIVQLFLTISALLVLTPRLYARSAPSTRDILTVAVAGATTQILLLTKQNVGLGMFLGFGLVVIGVLITAGRRRARAYALKALIFGVAFLATFAATGVVFLRAFHPDGSPLALYISFFLIGSKGSPLYAATRLLHDTNNFDTIWPAFIITAVICIVSFSVRYLRQRLAADQFSPLALGQTSFKMKTSLLTVSILAILPIVVVSGVLAAIIIFPEIYLWDFWPCIFTFTCYFLDVFFLLSGIFGMESEDLNPRMYDIARVVIFGMVMLAHSMTAALNIVGLAVFFGFYMAMVIHHAIIAARKAGQAWQSVSFVSVLMIALAFVLKLELGKLDTPYAWWGTQEPPVYGSAVKMTGPYLDGLRLSSDRASMIHSIVATVEHETAPTDPILVYPNIPLFYMLTNRLPQTKTYVQWFDFATNASLIPDFLNISEHPPKIIVEMSVPQAVYIGHESLLGRVVPQRSFTEYMQCMVDAGAFTELNRFFYNRSNALEGTYSLRSSRAISAEQVNQIAALAVHYPEASYVVTGALGLDDTVISLSDIQKIADQKSGGFGGIVVKGNSDELPEFLRYLASSTRIKLTPSDDNFILRILKRQDTWASVQQHCPVRLHEALRLIAAKDAFGE